MAGFFGLFNYSKEGPGVAKNAPQKRGLIRFFEIYSRKFWGLALAGIMWFVVCIPLLTRGLADAGMTFITRSFTREKHAFVREDFLESIRKNWRPALTSGIINQLVTGVMLYNIITFTLQVHRGATPTTLSYIIIAVTLMVYGTFTWMKYYIPFLIITFKLNLKQVYKNAFLFSAVNLKRNLLISVILIGVYAVLFLVLMAFPNPLALAIILVLAVTVVPAFRSFLIQYHIFPAIKQLMIDPYYKANPGADKQLRRNLNLEVEEEENPTPTAEGDKPAAPEEPVFVDTIPEPSAHGTKKPLPKQYNERELRRFNRQVTRQGEDDDDTI